MLSEKGKEKCIMKEKQELLSAWDLLRQLEKVTSLLWERYAAEFTEMDRAETERRIVIENDAMTDEPEF
jgi:hypothetical protein